jgi:hypothetical protein
MTTNAEEDWQEEMTRRDRLSKEAAAMGILVGSDGGPPPDLDEDGSEIVRGETARNDPDEFKDVD